LYAVGWCDRVQALFASVLEAGHVPGRVVAVERGATRVATAAGNQLIAVPAEVAVGDWVVVAGPRIDAVLPRWTALSRRDPDVGVQVLAANLDLVIIAAPADRLSVPRVERELVVAWDSGARPVVVVTKVDLPISVPDLAGRFNLVDVIHTSAVSTEGLDELRSLLSHPTTAALLGPSGAGKSTLVNALIGEDRQAVGQVRGADHRGRHTTSSRQLIPLPTGGCLVDMPGLRSLGLTADETSVDSTFEDISSLGRDCRFSDCRHTIEPGCAVTAAIASGQVDPSRLASYQKLRREVAFEARRHDPLARAAELRIWKARTKEQRRRGR
jgi:ribosome biogenesis GTPase